MFYELHLMICTENRAHRSWKLLLEIELVFARGGDKRDFLKRKAIKTNEQSDCSSSNSSSSSVISLLETQPKRVYYTIKFQNSKTNSKHVWHTLEKGVLI